MKVNKKNIGYVRHSFTPVKNKLLNKNSKTESKFEQMLIDANIYFTREKGNYKIGTRWCYYDFFVPYWRLYFELDGTSHSSQEQKAIDSQKDRIIRKKQRSYWQGGNKNELVVCVGIDKNKNVKWCNAFSWCDSPVVGVKSRDWFMSNPVNLEKYAEYIGPIVEKEWHRKNFDDFDYLTIELTDVQYWVIIIILLIFNIVMSSWIVTNNYKNDL